MKVIHDRHTHTFTNDQLPDGEDDSRARVRNLQANLAVVRRLTVSVLKPDVSIKGGVRAKRFKAAPAKHCLLRLLGS
jgi:hypothetical protein